MSRQPGINRASPLFHGARLSIQGNQIWQLNAIPNTLPVQGPPDSSAAPSAWKTGEDAQQFVFTQHSALSETWAGPTTAELILQTPTECASKLWLVFYVPPISSELITAWIQTLSLLTTCKMC